MPNSEAVCLVRIKSVLSCKLSVKDVHQRYPPWSHWPLLRSSSVSAFSIHTENRNVYVIFDSCPFIPHIQSHILKSSSSFPSLSFPPSVWYLLWIFVVQVLVSLLLLQSLQSHAPAQQLQRPTSNTNLFIYFLFQTLYWISIHCSIKFEFPKKDT